ncbi:MAG: hypothetical protein ACYC57_06580, partial [Thermoleophilia bacterium]
YVSAGAANGVGSAIDVVELSSMTTVGTIALTGYNPHSVSIAHNEGFFYSHSRAVSGGQPASILVFDIGGVSGGTGTKTAPVLIGSFADGGGAGSCGVDVAAKSDYCGAVTLTGSSGASYYANQADDDANIVSVDLTVSNGGAINAIDARITGYSANNGVTAATTVPVELGDIPAGENATVTVKFDVPPGVTSFDVNYDLDAKDLCNDTQTATESETITAPPAWPDPTLADDLLSMGDAGNNRVRIIDVDAQAVVNDITGADVAGNHGTLWDGRYIWTANATQTPAGTMKVVKLDTATMGQSAAFNTYVSGSGGLCGIEFDRNVQGSNMWVLSMGATAGSNGAFEVSPTTGFTGTLVDTGSGGDNRATCGIGWDSTGTIAVASLMNAMKTTEMSWPAGTLTSNAATHSATIHILDTAKTAGYAYVSAGAANGVGSAIDVVELSSMTTVGTIALTGYNPHSVSIAHGEGYAYSHSRAVSGGQPASILVFDIGGGLGHGTKTAPVLVAAFADGGGAGSCGVDVAAKSDYCGPITLDATSADGYYADSTDLAAGIVSVDLTLSNNGINAINTALTGYSANNGVTAATTVPVDLGDIPAGEDTTVTLKFNVPNGVTTFDMSYDLSALDLCNDTQTTSSTETIATPVGLPKEYHFTWYDNNKAWGMNGDWITINNVDTSAARVNIYVAGNLVKSYSSIAAGAGVQWQSPTTLTDGPVKVVSTGGHALNVTQRVIYKNSFNEIRAVETDALESEYHFTWYDNNKAWGMKGNWIVVNNLGSSAADVDISIGGTVVTTLAIAAGEQGIWQSPTTLTAGPVNVIDNNSQPLLVSQRVIFKDSFNEVPGVPNSKLNSDNWLSWYDNNKSWGMNGNWIIVYNDGGSAANVEIKVDGVLKDTLAIPAGGYNAWKSPTTLTDGSVQVKDTNAQPLLVSQRVIYMDSFDEVAAVRSADAGDNADLNWYDNNKSWGMNGDWIVVTNLGASTTNIDIKVGGVSKKTKALTAGERYAWKSATTLTGGPVEVTSDNAQPLLVSQRILYKNSFNELFGGPSS